MQLQCQLQQGAPTPGRRKRATPQSSKKAARRQGMVLLVLDELDALMARDQSILVDLFRLPQVLPQAQHATSQR